MSHATAPPEGFGPSSGSLVVCRLYTGDSKMETASHEGGGKVARPNWELRLHAKRARGSFMWGWASQNLQAWPKIARLQLKAVVCQDWGHWCIYGKRSRPAARMQAGKRGACDSAPASYYYCVHGIMKEPLGPQGAAAWQTDPASPAGGHGHGVFPAGRRTPRPAMGSRRGGRQRSIS